MYGCSLQDLRMSSALSFEVNKEDHLLVTTHDKVETIRQTSSYDLKTTFIQSVQVLNITSSVQCHFSFSCDCQLIVIRH